MKFKNLNDFLGRGPVREATMSAIVIRADGTREDLGVIAYYHKNPFKRINFNLKGWLKKWQRSS